MTKGFAVLIVLLIMLAASSGCAAVGTYFKDRALDFVDCFKADVGYGYGLDVRVKVTDYIVPSVGFGYTWNAGFKGRYAGTWRNLDFGFPVGGVLAVEYGPGSHQRGCLIIVCNMFMLGWINGESLDYYDATFVPGGSTHGSLIFMPGIGLGGIRNMDGQFKADYPVSDSIINYFDIEVGGTLGVVGFQIGFSPGQFADFLLGWFGVDIGNDDRASLEAKEKENADK